MGASVLEIAAIGLFAAIILQTWRRSGKGLAFYDGYILSSLYVRPGAAANGANG